MSNPNYPKLAKQFNFVADHTLSSFVSKPQKRGVLVCVSVCHEADWPRHLSSPCPVISLCNSDKCQSMSRG